MDEQGNTVSLFVRLKEIRIKKKLDLKRMSKESRIHVKFLEAIEAGDFQSIPAVYDKMFFQAYISFLQLEDEQEVLEEYNKLRPKKSEPRTTVIQRAKIKEEQQIRSRLLKRLYFIVPLVILALILIILGINSIGSNDETDEGVKELTVHDIVKNMEVKNDQNQTEMPSTRPAVKKIPDSQKVAVGLSASERTWLLVVKDQVDSSEYMMQAGNQLNLTADSTLVFRIGNPAGVRLTVNGSDAGILGRAGEVINNLKITSDGIVSKNILTVTQKESPNDSLSTN